MKSAGTISKGLTHEDLIPTIGERLEAVNESVRIAIALLSCDCNDDDFLADTSIQRSELIADARKQLANATDELYWVISERNATPLAALAPDDDHAEAMERQMAAAGTARKQSTSQQEK